VYGRVGGRRIQSAHVATANQLQASEHLTPTAADPADLVDPAVSWGLSGRLEMVARLLGAGWSKWQIAAACGVTPGQVSRACAQLREVAA
jgi:DNA-binding NarL/FixJ family response regulator